MKNLNLHTITAAVRELMPHYDVDAAYLFGSYARGEANEASDVDICLECGNTFTLFTLGGIGSALEAALGTSVDVVCGSSSFYPRAQKRYFQDRKLLYARS